MQTVKSLTFCEKTCADSKGYCEQTDNAGDHDQPKRYNSFQGQTRRSLWKTVTGRSMHPDMVFEACQNASDDDMETTGLKRWQKEQMHSYSGFCIIKRQGVVWTSVFTCMSGETLI